MIIEGKELSRPVNEHLSEEVEIVSQVLWWHLYADSLSLAPKAEKQRVSWRIVSLFCLIIFAHLT